MRNHIFLLGHLRHSALQDQFPYLDKNILSPKQKDDKIYYLVFLITIIIML